MFDKDTFVELFTSAGLVDVRQETQRSCIRHRNQTPKLAR